MNPKIQVGIIESSGHSYIELLKLLKAHPRVNIVYLKNEKTSTVSKSTSIKINLTEIDGLTLTAKNDNQIDVLFLCGGPETGKTFLRQYKIPKKIKLICLTGEFRTEENSIFEGRKFIYGLPEIKKETIQKANNVSVPGGMATCVALGLLPVADQKLLRDVYITGISGSTENGGDVVDPENENSHKVKSAHAATDITLDEIKKPLANLSNGATSCALHFVPWKGEFSRGIFVTSQLKCTESLSEMYYIFEKFYEDRKFIHISKEPVFLKKVINTNDCYINLEKAGDILVVHSAIDNLMKGAAGQAIQNMNLMFGFDETLGLIQKSTRRDKK